MISKIVYHTLRDYVGTLLRHGIFSSVEVEGANNLPDVGTPTLLVGNHQNGLCDPLNVVCALTDRKVHIFTRGSLFNGSSWMAKRALELGMIPAYRMSHEGFDQVAKNKAVFARAGEIMMSGETLLIYPEGTHSERCHMGEFSTAYLRMAFEAAAANNYEKDVRVVPTGIHYDSYYGIQNRALLRFGTPLSLAPWYEQYKVKPRTTCREVNKIIRAAVEQLVLEIPEEDYTTREFLCISRKNTLAIDDEPLSSLLQTDQAVMETLNSQPADIQHEVLSSTRAYQDTLEHYGTTIEASTREQQPLQTLGLCALLALLAPLWVVCLWPGAIAWVLSQHLAHKSGNRCFANLYLLAVGGMVVMPLLGLATVIALGFTIGWTMALVWLLLQPLACLFAWGYARRWRELQYRLAYDLLAPQEVEALDRQRMTVETIYNQLRSSENRNQPGTLLAWR